MKSITKKQIKMGEKAIYACRDFLKAHGWNPLVGGFTAIEQGDGKYKFRLIFSFTGKPPENKIIPQHKTKANN